MKKIKSFFLGIFEFFAYIYGMWTVLKARAKSEKDLEIHEGTSTLGNP